MNTPTAVSQGRSTLLGFSTPRHFNPVSWVVRRFTGSECSHCFFLYWDDDFQCDMVLESHELGFRLITWQRFVANNRIIALIEPLHPLEMGFIKLGDWVGSAYDFQGLFGQSLVQVGRWMKRKWLNPSQSSKAMFCSESIVRCMQWAEHPEAATFSPKETTPQDLLTFYREATRGKALDIQPWA